MVFSLPLIVTAFSYHGTLPTIVSYLNQDSKKIRVAIFAGSGITLVLYIFWQYVMLGIIPLAGESSLSTALEADKTAMLFLEKVTGSSWVGKWGAAFSFVALTTSFLGVSIGVVDFFIDAFKLSRSVAHRCMISLSIFLPALFLAGAKVPVFYFSLKYGAGFACIFLLIFLPTVMNARNKRLPESIFHTSRSKIVYGVYLFVVLALISTFWDLFR